MLSKQFSKGAPGSASAVDCEFRRGGGGEDDDDDADDDDGDDVVDDDENDDDDDAQSFVARFADGNAPSGPYGNARRERSDSAPARKVRFAPPACW